MVEDNSIESLALSVRNEVGLSEPPINPAQTLGAYQLSMSLEPLEEILSGAGLSEDKISKVDAMLDVEDRCVFVREGMHDRKKNWSYIHELAHHIIPWHNDLLLYRCSILRLPPKLQQQFEREADEFAADVFFFGGNFIDEAMSLPFGLSGVVKLANQRYDVSLHAAFTRYASRNPKKCCLLVSSPVKNKENNLFDVELKYYVKSDLFSGHIAPHQVVSCNSPLGQLFNSGRLSSVVEHETVIGGQNPRIYSANSFFNGYNIFTLIWNPRPQVI